MHRAATAGQKGSHGVPLRMRQQHLSTAPLARTKPQSTGAPRYLIVTSAQPQHDIGRVSIKVIGVGGGGGNAINRIIESEVQGEMWVINTDAQVLAGHPCSNKMQIGLESTRGLGCGGNPEVGRVAAEESADGLKKLVAGADLLFVTAGMGGGTGTGAAPVVARLGKEQGILTAAIVTYPFSFEGRRRASQAMKGISALKECVDCLIIIPNDKLLDVTDRSTSLNDAFRKADDVLRQGVQGISDMIMTPGQVNIDMADIQSVMRNAGTAMMGTGCASGPDRAVQAARQAVQAPLLLQSVSHATGILYNVTGGPDLTLHEVMQVGEVINELADSSAQCIFGTVEDPKYTGEVHVTLIATGFPDLFEENLLTTTMGKGARQQQAGSGQQQAAVQ